MCVSESLEWLPIEKYMLDLLAELEELITTLPDTVDAAIRHDLERELMRLETRLSIVGNTLVLAVGAIDVQENEPVLTMQHTCFHSKKKRCCAESAGVTEGTTCSA